MAMELVTGYAGKAHVTSYQDAAIQAGIVGVDNGVLSYVGQGMKAVATSANNIRIYDGVALIGGKAVVIDRDTYQDVAIANGTVGKYRNDIIYIKYTKDAFTGVESVTFDVKQGAAGNSGIDPALTTNNLYSTGTLTSEIPFKRVRLNGLAIESVENMHDIVPSLSELNRNLPQGIPLSAEQSGVLALESARLKIIYGTYPLNAFINHQESGGYAKEFDISKYGLKDPVWGTASARYPNGHPHVFIGVVNANELILLSDANVSGGYAHWMVIGNY